MNKLKVILAGALLAGLSGTATARDNVSFSISIGTPGYAFGYVQPAPVYHYGPPPVYYGPPRAYYGPRTYYVPRPVMVAPRYNYRHDRQDRRHGWHRGHR